MISGKKTLSAYLGFAALAVLSAMSGPAAAESELTPAGWAGLLDYCQGAILGCGCGHIVPSTYTLSVPWARSLGFNRYQTMRLVVLPQAMRTILPPVGNECIAMLKDTSLVSIMAVPDIMQRARSFVGTTYLYFETYTLVAIIYLIITLVLSKAVSIMESRLNYYDGK